MPILPQDLERQAKTKGDSQMSPINEDQFIAQLLKYAEDLDVFAGLIQSSGNLMIVRPAGARPRSPFFQVFSTAGIPIVTFERQMYDDRARQLGAPIGYFLLHRMRGEDLPCDHYVRVIPLSDSEGKFQPAVIHADYDVIRPMGILDTAVVRGCQKVDANIALGVIEFIPKHRWSEFWS